MPKINEEKYTLEKWIIDSDVDGRGILFQFTDSDIPILYDCIRQKIEQGKIQMANEIIKIIDNWKKKNKCVLFNGLYSAIEDTLLKNPKNKKALEMKKYIDEVYESIEREIEQEISKFSDNSQQLQLKSAGTADNILVKAPADTNSPNKNGNIIEDASKQKQTGSDTTHSKLQNKRVCSVPSKSKDFEVSEEKC